MIEGTPSKSALFVNGMIGEYVSTNLLNSRYVSAYDHFVKIRKNINSINSSHVETVVLMQKLKE